MNKRQVMDDTLSMCYFYMQFGKSTNTDKNKLKNSIECIYENFMGIKPQKEFEDHEIFSKELVKTLE